MTPSPCSKNYPLPPSTTTCLVHYLHVRPARDVDDQVSELLPVPNDVDGPGLDLGVFARDRHGRGEGAVDGKYNGLCADRHDGQVHVEHGVVAADQHPDGIDAEPHSVVGRQLNGHLAVFVRQNGGDVGPISGRRVLHDVNVDLFSRQRRHVQRSVREPPRQQLGRSLGHDDVIAPVVRRPVPSTKHQSHHYIAGVTSMNGEKHQFQTLQRWKQLNLFWSFS